MINLSVNFDAIASIANLVGDIDATCSPTLDKREPSERLKAVQVLVAKAHAVIEKMLGEHAPLVYLPEEAAEDTPESEAVAA